MLESQLVVYKCSGEVFVCVVCSFNENELIMGELLEGIYGALCSVCQEGNMSLSSTIAAASATNQSLTKQGILEALDQVLLVLDEVVEDGIVLETDEKTILKRLRMVDPVGGEGGGIGGGGPNGAAGSAEETNAQVFQAATQAAKNRLLSSILGSGR